MYKKKISILCLLTNFFQKRTKNILKKAIGNGDMKGNIRFSPFNLLFEGYNVFYFRDTGVYDWFKGWPDLKDSLSDIISPGLKIIHLGCGNSGIYYPHCFKYTIPQFIYV